MRTLSVMFLALMLVAGCNRDKVEENNPPESATATDTAAQAATVETTGTSSTAPIAASGTDVVTPTDTSSTIVTPTTTTMSVTTPTETSATVATTTRKQ